MTEITSTTTRGGTWPAYAVCACAWLFAIPSLYWGLGGKFGARTVGREAARLTWEGDPPIMAVVLVTAILKILGGVFALALVRPWGRRIPRRMKLITGWIGATILVLYGAAQMSGQALVGVGVVDVPATFDWWAFKWHLFLWSPWFLVWGVLLGLAVLRYQHAHSAPSGPTATSGPA